MRRIDTIPLPALLAGAAALLAISPALQAGGGASGWLIAEHPCPGGNRTDALHLDESGRLWAGCGTNATGYGLFHSDDGVDWTAADVTPAGMFDAYRVSSISTGHDGAIYVAGASSISGNRTMVHRVDTSALPFAVTPTLVGVTQVGRTFHVGGYRELDDGRAIAEDLNGTYLLYRPDASTGTSASDWTRVEGAHQILDLQTDSDHRFFFGGGSRINEPPRLFLPPDDGAAEPWEFVSFALPTTTGWDGEIWGVASNDERVYAVGVDQDADVGKIYVSGTDPYVAADYVERSVDDFLAPGPGFGTWARGVCARNNTVVVVGERQPLGSATGFVLMSHDGGQTFADITPDGVGASVSKCLMGEFVANGQTPVELVVAGAAGFVGLYAGDRIHADGFEASNN